MVASIWSTSASTARNSRSVYGSGGKVNEVRLDDLRFSRDEVIEYLSRSQEEETPQALVELGCEQIEGWPLALRLLILSFRGKSAKEIGEKLPKVPARVESYLVEEILEQIPETYLEAVLQSSILTQFCPELCEFITPGLDGGAFVKWLESTNLFTIPLDEEGRCLTCST